jgi:nicotinamidase-related amidase
MPITEIDPTAALVVVDLQEGIVALPLAHPVAEVIERVTTLARHFRGKGMPVVLVNVAGTPTGRTDQGTPTPRTLPDGWTDLVKDLDQQPTDIKVTKHARSAFTNTALADQLRERGITQVVVTGIATSSGVESTARDAHEQGFHVTLPTDAMTDSDQARHDHSVKNVFPRIAETGTTEEALAAL